MQQEEAPAPLQDVPPNRALKVRPADQATARRAPKLWKLTEEETITSLAHWQQVLVYSSSLNPAHTEYVQPGIIWGTKTRDDPNHDYVDDADGTATLKNQRIEKYLTHVASYTPIIPINSVMKQSTSLQDIMVGINSYLGFEASGVNFLDLDNFRPLPGEKFNALLALCGLFLIPP